MHVADGYFDKAGTPHLKIILKGAVGQGVEFEAIMDTGFTGFLSMPLIKAFPVGLILSGTTTVTFGDGSKGAKLTAIGTIVIGARQEPGVVILEENASDILLGMDFLRTFKASIVMAKDTFGLFEHDWLEQIQKAGEKLKREAEAKLKAVSAAAAKQLEAPKAEEPKR